MLTQFPTPLDCIRRTARSPPSHAPQASATPSSSVVRAIAPHPGVTEDSTDDVRVARVGDPGDLAHAGPLQETEISSCHVAGTGLLMPSLRPQVLDRVEHRPPVAPGRRPRGGPTPTAVPSAAAA